MTRSFCFLVCFAAASFAVACNIPVFRYALERWRPDSSEMVVFVRGSLTAEQSQTLQSLQHLSVARTNAANLEITIADVSEKLEGTAAELWQNVKDSDSVELPHVVTRSRLARGRYYNSWQGSLAELRDADLVDSPVRQELARRLVSGDAIVWLMMTSGNERANQGARELLTTQFAELNQSIQLPQGIGEPGSELYSDVPLLLKFSLLEFDPADPREQLLVNLLEEVHPGAVAEGKPLVVPVFGRGRALEVIPADQLDVVLVGELTRFLCGACSCQVKDLNPGFDLLLKQNWDVELFGEDLTAPRPQESEGAGQQRKPVLVPIPPGRGKK